MIKIRRPADGGGKGNQEVRPYSIPASVGGWNARDSIAEMPPEDALTLTNIFPQLTFTQLRKGSANYWTTLGAAVTSLLVYRPMTGSEKMWAAVSTKFVEVTGGGSGSTGAVTGLTANHPWEHVNFATASLTYMFACNGTDSVYRYDTTNSWKDTSTAGAWQITGVTLTSVRNLAVLHNRLWFILNNSTQVFYLGTNAIAGAVTSLELGPLLTKGGFIVAAGGWSMDAGVGMQEYSVFISDQGQAVVFQGYDPSNAALWQLVGVYNLGMPVGRRCMLKYGSDLLILTTDGLWPASKAFITSRTNQGVALSYKIQNAITTALNLYSSTDGWQPEFYAGGQMLLLAVPSTPKAQFVMNTISKAWCLFSGWDAQCFAIFNDLLYFGDTSGKVVQAWTGVSDAGANIMAEWQPSFQYLGNRNIAKAVELIRPLIAWDSNPARVLLGIDADFIVNTPIAEIILPITTTGGLPVAVWDTALWDQAVWAGDPTVKRIWYTGANIGYAISPHFLITTNASQMQFSAMDVLYRPLTNLQV